MNTPLPHTPDEPDCPAHTTSRHSYIEIRPVKLLWGKITSQNLPIRSPYLAPNKTIFHLPNSANAGGTWESGTAGTSLTHLKRKQIDQGNRVVCAFCEHENRAAFLQLFARMVGQLSGWAFISVDLTSILLKSSSSTMLHASKSMFLQEAPFVLKSLAQKEVNADWKSLWHRMDLLIGY